MQEVAEDILLGDGVPGVLGELSADGHRPVVVKKDANPEADAGRLVGLFIPHLEDNEPLFGLGIFDPVEDGRMDLPDEGQAQ